MLQHQFIGRPRETEENCELDAVLRFNAGSAVQAIVFHALDEHLATMVTPESIQRTTERLVGKSFAASIARRRWTAMTNAQRLKWFLDETRTVMVNGENNFVMLRAKRGW